MRGFLKKLNLFIQPEQDNNVQIPIKIEAMEPMKDYSQDQKKVILPKMEQNANNMPQGGNKLMPAVIVKQKENVISIENKETRKNDDRQIVIVNNGPIVNNKEGYYTKKYSHAIQSLKLSQPIKKQRETMKVCFDKDAIEYLFNEMTNLFQEKANIIDKNQKELLQQINNTHERIGCLYEQNKNTDESLTNYKKQEALIEQIDYLELYINSISVQADQLLEEVNLLEKKINNKEKL